MIKITEMPIKIMLRISLPFILPPPKPASPEITNYELHSVFERMADFLHSRLLKTAVRDYFTWLFKQVHCPSKNLETLRFAMCFKILSCIPFFNQAESVFILHVVKKITMDATLFHPDGADERDNRLGKFLTFFGRHLHMHDDENHTHAYEQKACRQAKTGGDMWENLLLTRN
jgi:hypothetical protein